MFTPQRLPKLGGSHTHHRVQNWREGERLPWHPTHPLNQRPPAEGKVWGHRVYLGVFEADDIYTTLDRYFGVDPDVTGHGSAQQSACAAVVVNDQGLSELDTLIPLGAGRVALKSRGGW